MQFSEITIDALAKLIVGDECVGIRRSGTQIERFMIGCESNFKLDGGSRFPTLYSFLCRLNNNSEAFQLRKIIEGAGDPRLFHDDETSLKVQKYLNRFLVPDGFELLIAQGKAKLVNQTSKGILAYRLYDFDTVDREVKRIAENLSHDPEDCITAACSLLEAMCRSILVEMNIEIPKDRSLNSLLKAVQVPLGLSSKQRGQFSEEISVQVRTILGALSTVAQGISALRTCSGDAHGREKGFPKIDARIARLAVNAANTLSIFLIETWEGKMKKQLTARES